MPFKIRYSLEEYNQAIALHKQGLGSLRISKILGYKTRGAIEDWINKGRKPYYSSKKRMQYCNSIKTVERMRAMNKLTQPKAVKISAELRTKKLPEYAKELTEELAYVLGVVYCDGHVSVKQRRVILSATDQDFVLNFKDKLEKWSKFKTRFYSRNLKKPDYIKTRKLQYVSYIDSKEASVFLKEFDLTKILNSTNEIKYSFLKGCFDSEGGVTERISFYNTNLEFTLLIKNLLKSINIDSTLLSRGITNEHSKAKTIYILSINKFIDKLNYLNNIGFSIKRKEEKLQKYLENKSKLKNKDKITIINDKID
ncbi:MAG: LAGLIDADG family homing endonuclease [Candidatus Nanoarchaeia archaeon]|nr:LAGLIDADG family homing endonuclease [Candidatus Nanoarchaeia archaeon]MDD5587925.1 LAGLIDADG family homing endonuclease [Candidatus Nanoarchaeia archaeon]